jgi:hypothetical protein
MRFEQLIFEPARLNRECLDHRAVDRLRSQRQRWYHTRMDKTTIYLPTELKSAIKRVARQRGVSEAEVIRDSIRDAVGDHRPRPRGGLFASRAPIAREADEHLPGFGER